MINMSSMTVRTLLYMGNKCLTTTQYCRPQLQISQYRQIRSLRRLRIPVKQTESPFSHVQIETGIIQPVKLWKHLAFTVTFSGACIVGAAICEYERIRSQTYKLINRFRQHRINRTEWRSEMEAWWRNLSEGQKVFVPICFINVVIFLAWRVPALQKTMVRYFCANPASSVSCWPMILSTFSHYYVFHLAANMYVLHSFSTTAVSLLGREQFLALYLSSGVVSSFASHLYKTILGAPGLSLGASGAIMGVLGFVCTQYPDINLSIVFLPMLTFKAGAAIKAVMALDVAGCILRWKFFDHAGHLGGVFFGIFWQTWGNANIWQKREPLLTLWHKFREPRKSQ